MKQFRLSKFVNALAFLLIVLTFSLASPMTARAQPQKVAILPFTVNAEKDLTYIKEGVSQMLSSRLAWKDQITTVPGKIILSQIHNAPQLSGDALMKAVAENTAVQYIVSGSITEFAGTFSVDTKVYSSAHQFPVQTFSSLADTEDNIIPAINSIASEINQKIFNRQTLDWAEADAGENSHQKELIRANPETLIPQVHSRIKAKEKPFWMFWKKEEVPFYPDEESLQQQGQPIPPLPPEELDDEMDHVEKVPFWKFWKKSSPQDMDDEMDLEIPESLDENSDDAKDEGKPFWKFW